MAATVATVVLLGLVALPASSGVAAIDECSNFTTCETCLFNGSSSSRRVYCGWCHSNVVYKDCAVLSPDNSIGKKCVDVRGPSFICPSEYNTDQCTADYACDYATGKCSLAPAGSGLYPDQNSCQAHCFKTPSTYLCNTTTYQCQECKSTSDPNCSDKTTACENCNPPASAKFKCDISNPESPTCKQCAINEANCSDFKTACSKCNNGPNPTPASTTTTAPGPTPPAPPTPPPTPTPPPPPQKFYSCNPTQLVCEESASGNPQSFCNATCGHFPPADLKDKTFRGVEISKRITLGEFDFNFSDSTVTLLYPNNTQGVANVTMNGQTVFTWLSGPLAGTSQNILDTEANYGPETIARYIALAPPGQDAPYTVNQAMQMPGVQVFVVFACEDWKSGSCNFSSVFDSARAQAQALVKTHLAPAVPHRRPRHLYAQPIAEVQAPADTDPCNAFTNCSECVAAAPGGDVKCGWCMGGHLHYNSSGDSPYKCAGYTNGIPHAFTCEGFRTEDCSGYSCNWTQTLPQCYKSDEGEYQDDASCEATCQPNQMASCNPLTKQCEICSQGSPNCTQTKAECDAICDLPHAKCNMQTLQCESCDISSDPDCTDTVGSCQEKCTNQTASFGECDPLTGQCIPCNPDNHEAGCVKHCNASCAFGGLYICNHTDQTCQQNLNGNMSLEACVNDCLPPNPQHGNFGCDFSNPAQPKCVAGEGNQTQTDCSRNCHAPPFAKCNYVTGQCEACNTTDPACQYTTAECAVFCHASGELLGIFRGIAINKDFTRTEWDVQFFSDGKVAFMDRATNDKYEADFSLQGNTSSGGAPITLSFHQAPANGALPVQPGDQVAGLYLTLNGEAQEMRFLYLGLGTASTPATDFDTAMSTMEFALVGCLATDGSCNFSPATIPE
ncbi:uncharacterized protein MONBRDRAFT_29569 [Monosiga brevicollis MX1]|uniref:PSI domain-containing protein n=1 Tax=Monosiga brevicollis TaxID=81824 RepID=A9VBH0_MONBE|nr:uncharacterized protein MONBRDRAFT_29569 [Monosiga brevicollis MX1]EDQ85098.1 predicted protein [Monosiga brevicollis MX1]|eukprot:XP_001750102.1 hypothetical protein [Monosiga brevicollis MX1]